MGVRIFRPAKSAMQSGRAANRDWVLEYEPETPRFIDPLMGWTGSADTREQVRLRFPTREAAVAFAERRGLDFRVVEPHPTAALVKTYADKLRSSRMGR